MPNRNGLLAVLAGNMLLDALDVSIVLVGLPVLATSLRLSPFSAQWLMSGFAAGFAIALLLGPSITARWGRRVPYLVAMLVFAAASIAGGLSGSVEMIMLTRVVKGACAALTAPAGLAIIGDAVPAGPARTRAVSVYALMGAAGFSVGVVCAGVLTPLGWRWDLLAPAPVALMLAAAAFVRLPAGPGSPAPLRLPSIRPALANRPLMRCGLGAAAVNGVFLTVALLTTRLLHGTFGYPPPLVALGLLPMCLPVLCVSPLAPRLIARCGAPRLILIGAATIAAGCAVRLGVQAPLTYDAILPSLVLIGAGFALSFAALNSRAVQAAGDAGRATAIALYQCCVQCGAVVLLVAGTGVATLLRTDRPALLLVTIAALGATALASGNVTIPRPLVPRAA